MGKIVLEHEIRETIPVNLKVIRKANKLTQQRFADRMGIEQKRVGSWEEGRAVPSLELLIRICDEFNLDLKKFLTEKLCA